MSHVPARLIATLIVSLTLAACSSNLTSPLPSANASPSSRPSDGSFASPTPSSSPAEFSIWNANLAGWRDGQVVVVVSTWSALNGDPGPTSIWRYDPVAQTWATEPAPTGLTGLLDASAAGSNLTLLDDSDPPLTAVSAPDGTWRTALAPAGDALSNTLAPRADGRLMAIGDATLALLDPVSAVWTSSPLPADFVLLGATDIPDRYLLAPVDDISREGGLGNDFQIFTWKQVAGTIAGFQTAPTLLVSHAQGVQNLGNGDSVIRLADGWYRLDAKGSLIRVVKFSSPSPFAYVSDDTKTMAILDCHSDAVPGPNTDACDLSFGPASSPVPSAVFGRHDIFGLGFGPDGTLALLSGSRDGAPSDLRLGLAKPGGALIEIAPTIQTGY